MVVSSSERDDVVRRVEQRLGRTRVREGLVRETVDRTLGTLAARATVPTPVLATAALAAVSMPDLASRLRSALSVHGVSLEEIGAATAGRHTVVAARCPVSAESVVRSAATAIGARFNWRTEES
jgi:hypothetical protein